MIQRMVKIEGQLAPCHNCGRQPRHWQSGVKSERQLHHLECAPCQIRTAKFSTFGAAVEKWEAQETGTTSLRFAS